MNEIISYEASTDSPRREAEVADGYQITCDGYKKCGKKALYLCTTLFSGVPMARDSRASLGPRQSKAFHDEISYATKKEPCNIG